VFALPDFEAVEPGGVVPQVDDLVTSVSGAPSTGPAPLNWSGSTTAAGPGTLTSSWQLDDGVTVTAMGVAQSFPMGRYTVVAAVSDSWGDRSTDVRPVAATAPFAVEVVPLPSGPHSAPVTVSYGASASGGVGPPFAYRWSFGDGSTAQGPNGTHTFVSDGKYEMTVTVTDLNNDSANDTVSFQVGLASTPTGAPNGWTVGVLVAGAAVGIGAAVVIGLRRRRPGDPGATL
jgi:PKD repeat protein